MVHSTGQLRNKYGEHGADTVWSCAGTKLFLPGIHDAKTLEDVSKLCGDTGTGEKAERVVPPELLRQLPDWTALVIRSNLSPLVVRFRPAWRRLDARLGRRPLPDLRPAFALRLPELRIPDTHARGRGLSTSSSARRTVTARPPVRRRTASERGRVRHRDLGADLRRQRHQRLCSRMRQPEPLPEPEPEAEAGQ